MKRNNFTNAISTVLLFIIFGATTVFSQTTEFSYQGFLSDNSASANGNFDFEFRLFDVATGGTSLGSIQRQNVAVTNGVFSVVLDFGAFPAANRFLEIAVRPPGGSVSTTLAPRSKILSTPYATNAQNSSQLGGVNSNQFVLTGDLRLTDARNPLPNSANYIQNRTTQQASTNFTISGNGTAVGTLSGGIVNAVTQYNFGSNRILAKFGVNNLYLGTLAGNSNGGIQNTLVGDSAGKDNTGDENAFFGFISGQRNTTGGGNAFFGSRSGAANTDGTSNTFFGSKAGIANTTGEDNTFVGFDAGKTITTGARITLLGADADGGNAGLSNAAAIGSKAFVTTSNSLVLGSISGINGALFNTNVGIGTTAPNDRLHVNGTIRVETLGLAGTTGLCRNSNEQISVCSSSLRYKTAIAPFSSGLNLVNQLKPITFNWKDGGLRDLGLGAEDVAEVEPLLVTYNETGAVEGVKYDRVAILLLNAVKEQQTQIEQQQKQLQQQQNLIEGLRKVVCPNNPQAEVCE